LVGTETLALVFTWTLLLLAEYPEWQECAWAEILEVCGHNINIFDASMLTQMKIVRGFLSYLYFNAYNLLFFYIQVGCVHGH
jgi:cytochrome P450